TALVFWPPVVEKFSAGRAKNARKAMEWPSMSIRVWSVFSVTSPSLGQSKTRCPKGACPVNRGAAFHVFPRWYNIALALHACVRPSSAIGTGNGFKNRPVWVRVPPGAPYRQDNPPPFIPVRMEGGGFVMPTPLRHC